MESADTISEDQIPAIDSNFCECHELTFDEAYNHFYRFERRKGFFGKCEEYHPDGSLKLEKNFNDGKVHGKMISYHENGQIWEDQEFDMNFQVGEKIIYTQSGQVKFHALYKRGQQTDVLVAKPWLTLED
jgi:antitoxin component YwqK of YwqJK toxin-antitoxin module